MRYTPLVTHIHHKRILLQLVLTLFTDITMYSATRLQSLKLCLLFRSSHKSLNQNQPHTLSAGRVVGCTTTRAMKANPPSDIVGVIVATDNMHGVYDQPHPGATHRFPPGISKIVSQLIAGEGAYYCNRFQPSAD